MNTTTLPKFSHIDTQNYTTQLSQILDKHLQEIDSILANLTESSWETVMQPLDAMSDEVERIWAPFSHLHAVVNSAELREVYQACLPKLSAYESAIGQNQELFNAITKIDESTLNAAQQKIVEDAIRDFKLAGVALSAKDKKRFEEINTELSKLTNIFENNILDAVGDFTLHIEDAERLEGLPEHLLASSKQLAADKKLAGWLLNLEQPSFLGVITYAEDRDLRKELYEAYVTRASDLGPSAGKFDNTQLMNEILSLRAELAKLLGYANYAEVSLATKMADSTTKVNEFLHDLAQIAYPKAQQEFKELQSFACENLKITELMPWDIAFASEKMLHAQYDISQEKLRPYFPLPKVLSGLFSIISRLYGMRLEKVADVDVWHPDVECYAVIGSDETTRGYLYLDLFARENKRSGAWMNSMQSRYVRADGSLQLPIATLTCNFAKAVQNKPAILSHDELETLFHECGHCLHHVLTKVDYISASGVNGVEWDAVELPSQFFENWCWDKEALQLLTEHVETKEHLPDAIYDKLLASKNFLSAMALVRQLEFALFDFRIHEQYVHNDEDFIPGILSEVREEVTVVPVASYNRFQHSFSHIFAGGYAAGYYSYKWAEVLSADAFSKFEQDGVFNSETGREFLNCILEVGGSQKAQDAFVSFRGREPKVDALLRHSGIV